MKKPRVLSCLALIVCDTASDTALTHNGPTSPPWGKWWSHRPWTYSQPHAAPNEASGDLTNVEPSLYPRLPLNEASGDLKNVKQPPL